MKCHCNLCAFARLIDVRAKVSEYVYPRATPNARILSLAFRIARAYARDVGAPYE